MNWSDKLTQQEVLNDLVTLYAAGEASPATRALVEEYLREHPETAARVNAPVVSAQPAPAADAGLRVLSHARRLILWRMGLLGFAITTMLVPFSFRFDGNSIRPLFWDNKKFVIVSECASAVAWIALGEITRRLRRTGLT
jgi:hypothetical protein